MVLRAWARNTWIRYIIIGVIVSVAVDADHFLTTAKMAGNRPLHMAVLIGGGSMLLFDCARGGRLLLEVILTRKGHVRYRNKLIKLESNPKETKQ